MAGENFFGENIKEILKIIKINIWLNNYRLTEIGGDGLPSFVS